MLRSRVSTLRARLLVLVSAAVLPVTAAILYGGYEQRRRAIADVEREALEVAASAAAEHDRLLAETRQLLRVLARVPDVRATGPACGDFLVKLVDENEQYVNLGVINADGQLVCSALPFTPPVDLSDREYFLRALQTRDVALGQYQIGRVTGAATVNLGYPLVDPAGPVQGVVFAAVPLEWLQQRLAQANLPDQSVIVVLDSDGMVLARFPEAHGWVGRSLAGTALAETIVGARDSTLREAVGLDSIPRVYTTAALQSIPGRAPVYVAVGIPTGIAFAPVRAAVMRNLIVLLLALLLVLAVTWWSSGVLVLEPVKVLVGATRRLSSGDLTARAHTDGAPREIDELAASFNDMAASLQQHVQDVEDHLAQISRLNRVRAVLSGINSAILRIRDRDDLLSVACRISVSQGEFELAWVAEPDPAGGIRAAAHATRGDGARDNAVPAMLLREDGMAAAAIREGTEFVSNRLHASDEVDSADAPLRDLGFRSAAALPLRVDDGVVASLNLYTTELDFFTGEELRLIRELSADTSLGLEYLEKEKQLNYLANYDTLTDLPNRSLFGEHLRQAVGQAREEGTLAAVLFVGIQRLSEINATLGHQVGDTVLQEVAQHLLEAAGEGGTVARLGSSDFGVVLPAADTIRGVEAFANELLTALPNELRAGDDTVFLAYALGIAVFPHDGSDPDVLIRAASLALDTAGSHPVHPIAFHSAELDEEAQGRRRMSAELRGALARDELSLLYQPVVDLASVEPIGMEALIRWHSPVLGDVSPVVFIPLAEEIGIIGDIGEWVLGTAAREGRRLHEDGLTELRMNVNVSVSQLRNPDFVQRFTRIIEETGIDLERLGIGIEITESELMENLQQAFSPLEDFRRMGLWIYIDDFGTGYSSLSYLRRMPIDSLKIDASFVRDLPDDPDAVAIVKTIIALARGLDLRVIAEGIETEEQCALLRDLGCHSGQGYFFSRPLPANELNTYLIRSA